MRFGRYAVLRSPEGDGTGAGGGAGDGGFTEAQLAQITKTIEQVANATFTARDKQAEKKRKDELTTAFKSFLPDLESAVEAKLAGAGANAGKKSEGGDNVALQTVQKQLESQKSELELIKQERDAERQKNREAELRARSIDGLASIGIKDPFMAKVALAHLREEGRIGRDSDDPDVLVWNDQEGGAIALDVGLRGWAKSEEAKRFLPAIGMKGSGAKRASVGAAAAGAKTREEIGQAISSALADELG